jgi:S-adenosylmethionine:tRNA ribosyltransferase-isomerase
MRTADFDFELPPELIAQVPAERRDASRLLVLDRNSAQITHRRFPDLLRFLRPGDVLVLNNSRVIPARLRGANERTGGQFEVLLLEENTTNDWWVMLRPGKRARVGTRIVFLDHAAQRTPLVGEVTAINAEGHRRIRFAGTDNVLNTLDEFGELPLPPYIERPPGKSSERDLDRYQTVFAHPPGSVAAPTAGLHFTPELLDAVRALGVRVEFVTLHVGLGTFAPVKTDHISEHVMHEERFEVSNDTAAAVNHAKQNGHRVIAIGTTSMRVLESAAASSLPMKLVAAPKAFGVSPLHLNPAVSSSRLTSAATVQGFKARLDREILPPPARGRGASASLTPGPGRTRIFIHPPHTFHIVDALLTNFHLPRSTLLMLASAFAAPGEVRGRELVLRAYAEAVRERYRFFSYGDAMFIQ